MAILISIPATHANVLLWNLVLNHEFLPSLHKFYIQVYLNSLCNIIYMLAEWFNKLRYILKHYRLMIDLNVILKPKFSYFAHFPCMFGSADSFLMNEYFYSFYLGLQNNSKSS